MPNVDNQYYKDFAKVFGTKTDESAMPSLKTIKDRGAKIPFNATCCKYEFVA